MVEIQKPPKNIDAATYNYLYQLAEFLALRLGSVEATAEAAAEEVKKKRGDTLADSNSSEYQAIKSLIIKTADVTEVRESIEGALDGLAELETKITREYVAASEFGTYLEQLNGTITLDSEGLQQFYGFVADLKSNVEKVSAAFNDYRIETEGYIRTGIVDYDEYGAPVFGMAVGRNLEVTAGEEYDVIEKRNFRALYTDNRLSFWQDEVEVAYMSNNQLYITNVVALDSLTVGQWKIETKNGFAVKWIGG